MFKQTTLTTIQRQRDGRKFIVKRKTYEFVPELWNEVKSYLFYDCCFGCKSKTTTFCIPTVSKGKVFCKKLCTKCAFVRQLFPEFDNIGNLNELFKNHIPDFPQWIEDYIKSLKRKRIALRNEFDTQCLSWYVDNWSYNLRNMGCHYCTLSLRSLFEHNKYKLIRSLLKKYLKTLV